MINIGPFMKFTMDILFVTNTQCKLDIFLFMHAKSNGERFI